MKPLNPTDVIWLGGTGEEVDRFLKSGEVRDHMIILGHPDDARKTIIATAQPGLPWEINFKPLLQEKDLEIVFVLVQGKVVGLVKHAEVKDKRE
jgi:hypothetical protein